MLSKAKVIYNEYPKTFWVLMGSTFIDGLGGALIFPFFSLYITQKFNVGLTEVGQLFAIWALANVFGQFISGALTDKFGRKAMIMFGLIVSALTSVALGLVNDINKFYLIAALAGLMADVAGPARMAMVADLLPEEQHAEGYGTLRVVWNLTVVIGPAIGGLLAAKSFLLLFILDAISSMITAAIVLVALPESKPDASTGEQQESLLQTMRGYGTILRNFAFMAFLIISMLVVAVYMQMNSTLAVYLRDSHGLSVLRFGYLMSMNALMVVIMQFWITRKLSERPPMLMMMLGTALYGIGFAMYGFVNSFAMFALAMIIITLGEMVNVPVAQAVVSKLAPESMRGRYMAMYGFSWILPSAFGPWVAGYVMDNYDPNLVWYAAGVVSALAVGGYMWLHVNNSRQETPPLVESTVIQPAASNIK